MSSTSCRHHFIGGNCRLETAYVGAPQVAVKITTRRTNTTNSEYNEDNEDSGDDEDHETDASTISETSANTGSACEININASARNISCSPWY